MEVSARDADIGLNGEVRYRFKKLANGHWKAFNIHEISGVITVREPLDRERQKVYEVSIFTLKLYMFIYSNSHI